MRRAAFALLLGLLAFAALFAWRLWSPRQHPPAADDLADLLDSLPHVASVEGDVRGGPSASSSTCATGTSSPVMPSTRT